MTSYEVTVCHKGNCAPLPVAFVAGSFFVQVERDLVLCLPRLTVLVSIKTDRPGAWFPGPLGPYQAWLPGIGLNRDFKRVKVSETP
jgi:hypothetical protein